MTARAPRRISVSKTGSPPLRWECACGCGKSQMVRRARVDKTCEAYVATWECAHRVPRPRDGRIRHIVFNACGSFYGLRHAWPDAQEQAALERAAAICAAGVASLAIDKARAR